MKNRKSKLLILALVIATMLCTVFAVMASASETENAPKIISKNIQYGEKYSIMYAVDANSVVEGDVTLKVYTQYPNVEDGKTFTYVSKAPESIKISGEDVSAYVFITGGIPAQDFADKFYAQAFDSEGNASEVVTYSVVEYMLERLYGGYDLTEVQEELYTTALAFGAASQKRFNPDDQYKVNDYKYVRVVGGTANGVTKGMFIKNTALTLDAEVPTGYTLSGWKVNGEENLVTENAFALEDNAIIEAVFEEIKVPTSYEFEDGNVPLGFVGTLKSEGSTITVTSDPLNGTSNQVLKFDTNAGGEDMIIIPFIGTEDNATKVVFETKYYVDATVNGTQTFEYMKGSTRVGYVALSMKSDGTISVSDYANSTNSFSSKTIDIGEAKWVNIKLVSYKNANNAFCTEIWIDNEFIVTSNHTSWVNTTVDSITGVRFSALKALDADIYFDGVKLIKVVDKVDGYYTFDDGELPSGFVGTLKSEGASISVADAPLNNTSNNALKFDTNAGAEDMMSIALTEVEDNATKVVFETKYYADVLVDGTQAFDYMSGNTQVGYVALSMKSDGKFTVSDYANGINSFSSKTLDFGEAKWVNIKLVSYKDVNDAFCTEIWINGELVVTSTNTTWSNTTVDSITSVRFRALKALDADVYFDNTKLSKIAE